jgi:two-component system, NarL family, response regulator NreC
MGTRIIIADDHTIMRQGLRSLIEKQKDMEVIAEAENGKMAVALANELKPDIILMDVTMPDLNGIGATQQIMSSLPETKIIALSMHSDRQFITSMLRCGASGYLLKDCAFEEVINAIRTVLSHRSYLSPSIIDKVVQDYTHPAGDSSSAYSLLTNREREILQNIAEGKSVKEIAQLLFLSIKTVETHRQQIMNKLGIHSIAELTKYAIQEGLTTINI